MKLRRVRRGFACNLAIMKNFKGIKYGLIILALAVILIVVNITGFSKKIKNFFYSVSAPIQKIFWHTGNNVSTFFETILEIRNLKQKTDDLEVENQRLLSEIAKLKELSEENAELREALQVGLQKEYNLSFAAIIGKDTSQEFIVIDKGSDNGITEKMTVITSQKILIGRVVEVYENFSRVQLISNTKSSFDVKIQDKDITGLLKGEGNQRVLLDLVPTDKEISEGDIVMTSELGGIFPAGILIGKVSSVRKSDTKPFQQANLNIFFKLKESDKVFIIVSLK